MLAASKLLSLRCRPIKKVRGVVVCYNVEKAQGAKAPVSAKSNFRTVSTVFEEMLATL